MKKVLITGGCGYIGSHIAEILVRKRLKIIVIDNFKSGYKKLLNKKAKFYKLNILNTKKLNSIIRKENVDSVIHLAASLSISEGEKFPKKYFTNNVTGTLSVVNACLRTSVKNFIFSSSAAVYKDGLYKVKENSKLLPKSVYGKTKLFGEKIIKKNFKKKINYGILRYFNVVGASKSGKIGLINKSDHLFKNISSEMLKSKPKINIYGNNYNTPDGTPVRDFIHVSDLANLHFKVLKKISSLGKSIILNCGYGKGISVLEVANEFTKQSKKPVKIIFKKRRKGDMEKIITDTKLLKNYINWKPKISKLKDMVKTTNLWETKLKLIKSK